MREWLRYGFVAAISSLTINGCSDANESEAPTGSDEQAWDSQGGNPTHATHSYLAEYAMGQLQGTYSELTTYRSAIIDGTNAEIHDLKLSDPTSEQIRQAVVGTNSACEKPEVAWYSAQYYYAHGNKHAAYWFLGLLLHYVADMGVPAHGFGVYHQSSPSDWDTFEVQALQRWYPSYSNINKSDPKYSNPASYVKFSGNWSTGDFSSTYPGSVYSRTFFSSSPFWASSKEKTFMQNRQGRTAVALKWAMASAMQHWNN